MQLFFDLQIAANWYNKRKKCPKRFLIVEGNADKKEIKALSALDLRGVSYIRLTHAPAVTMELCSGIGTEYNAKHVKNIFLTNKQGTKFYLLLMSAEKEFRTSAVSKTIGVPRLSFAAAESLREITGLEGGEVSVMCVVNDCAKKALSEGKLRVVIDRDVLERENVCVHPNIPTSTLVIKTSELLRFLGEEGVAFTAIEIF